MFYLAPHLRIFTEIFDDEISLYFVEHSLLYNIPTYWICIVAKQVDTYWIFINIYGQIIPFSQYPYLKYS